MLDFESMKSGAPVPSVSTDDVRRVWVFIVGTQHQSSIPNISFDVRLIAQQCSPGANALAVFFRTALLQLLLKEGMLNDWREGDELRDIVFDAVAAFPLQKGIQGFDPNAFVSRLRSSTG